MKKTLIVSALALAAVSASAAVPFKLGMARYTMRGQQFDEAVDVIAGLDCHYMGLIDSSLSYDATDAEIAAYKAKLAAKGIEVVSCGPLYCADEETVAKCFKFAKRYGMKYISAVPFDPNPAFAAIKETDPKKVWEEKKRLVPDTADWRLESDRMIDILERYVKEYDIRVAIHNHGPDIPKCYPTAEAALARIGNRDKRLGVCLDVGHEARAGLDPVEFIRQHADRIYEVHIKNIKIDPVKNLAMEGPRGELDIPAIVKGLADAGFDGYALVEYEKGAKADTKELAETFGYFRGVMDTTSCKAKLDPVPAGANTLTDAEKADGFELLFDGKTLPTAKFVGVKKEWGLEKFPERGWYVKDGFLAMRPVSGIANGKWFPLPEQDQKLGGGGDIVTVKKYRDFIFKFDFRCADAANSGIKYYYDETVNGASCEEYQILDPQHPDATKGKDGNRRVGALYDIFPSNADQLYRGPGKWNSGMIVARGSVVEHWLNGQKVLVYDRASQKFADGVNASKYAKWGKDADGNPQPWGLVPEGRLQLQDHGDSSVSFCNLKLKEL